MADDLNTFMSNRPNTYRTALYYIASPYSHNDPKVVENRTQDAIRAADAINMCWNGVTAYSPIEATVSMHERGITPKEGRYLI